MEKSKLDYLWFMSVFIFTLNFLGIPNYIMIFTVVVGIIISYYKNSTFKFTREFVLIIFFSLTYYLILLYNNDVEGVGKFMTFMLGSPLFFFVGYSVPKKNTSLVKNSMLVASGGYFIHGALNIILYIREFGLTNAIVGSRVLPDIWSGSELTATLQGTFFTLSSSLLFLAIVLFFKRREKLLPIIIILSSVIAVLASFVMGNRTLLVIVSATFIMNFIIYNLLMMKNVKKIIRLSISVIIMLLFFILLLKINFLGIKDFVNGSTLFNRTTQLSIKEDIRWKVYPIVFEQILRYPFGGYQMDLIGLSYAHNMWLDVANATGIIPFVLLVLFTWQNVITVFRIIAHKLITTELKILIFSIFFSMNLNFMVEPIFEGVPFMFITFCLFSGMNKKILEMKNKAKGEYL